MILKVTNLAVRFGKVEALAVTDLALPAARLCVVTGPNGAGKSTLLQILAGLLKPTTGDVEINGARPGSLDARRVVSFVPDLPALFDDLTLDDQLHYVARLHKNKTLPEACLDLVGRLDAEGLLTKFPRSMSKGQRQKAALLVGVARPFTLLLLDEPTTGLDAASRTALIEGLSTFARAGSTLLASTHNQELIDAADMRIELVDGRLVVDEI